MTDGVEYVAAASVDRDRLILDHLALLHFVVGRMTFDVPGYVEREDLAGWGMLGLIAAADTFDAVARPRSSRPSPTRRSAARSSTSCAAWTSCRADAARSCASWTRSTAELEQQNGTEAEPPRSSPRDLGVDALRGRRGAHRSAAAAVRTSLDVSDSAAARRATASAPTSPQLLADPDSATTP